MCSFCSSITSFPSWAGGTENAFQVKNSSIYGYSDYESGYQVNAYYNAGWKYVNTTTKATQIVLSNGVTQFNTSAGGTAGGAITWIPTLTIASTGAALFNNIVQIGGTTGGDKLNIENSGTTSYSAMRVIHNNSTAQFYVGIGGSAVANTPLQNNAYIMNAAASGLALGTSDAVRMFITSGGNVGIGTTTPASALTIGSAGELRVYRSDNARYGTFYNDNSYVHIAASTDPIRISSIERTELYVSGTERMRITSGGNVGIGASNPLATLSTLGGAVQFMGDYVNMQTIIKSAGTAGTLSGNLLITIPEMSNASTDGYGGYSCEVYVSGYSGMYCHAWFSGYINGGITPGEATILRSNGGWSISQVAYGTYSQGFQFTIDYPSNLIHPTARIIFNKGGSPNATAYPANTITAVFS